MAHRGFYNYAILLFEHGRQRAVVYKIFGLPYRPKNLYGNKAPTLAELMKLVSGVRQIYARSEKFSRSRCFLRLGGVARVALDCVEFRGVAWGFVGLRGALWGCVGIRWVACVCLGLSGVAWGWVGLRGISWGCAGVRGFARWWKYF